jgi:tetratricopeptide (TPR) repeat protein
MIRLVAVPRVPLLLVLAAALPAAGAEPAAPAAKVWEETIEIPTYRVGPYESNPMFFDGRGSQLAKGPIYPYPLIDNVGTVRENKPYRALVLENSYLRLSVLPEIGGRLYTALDKTNRYDFFYRQRVIKPAFIGMNGAWISGGIEWNVFHHHRVTSFMPVDWRIEEHPDGRRTVWVGEIERRHRMKWTLGITLHPDRSYFETTFLFFNRTPLAHAFLYFANPAVQVNDQYQVVFPPDTEYATYHAKDQFIEWPIGRRKYTGVDYPGVDLSWIKNHPKPTSFFAWDYDHDFIAGYDHGKKAGFVHVADHRIVSGKKLWQWGTGPTGRKWEQILTDADGPYAEIMTGAYSDNQPDYSWLQPGEVKIFKQTWYPIREMSGLKNATVDAAVGLEPVAPPPAGAAPASVRLAFNATASHRDAKAVLKAGDRVVFEKTIAIAPDAPFVAEVPLPAGVAESDLRAALVNAAGRELVAYQPEKKKGEPMPEPYKPPPPPKEIKTNEELYLAGSRLDQFYNPDREPDPYYEEVLRRDPDDIRANTALGLLELKRGKLPEAERRFRAAVRRATHNHTKARDGEPWYYLGVALRLQGRDAEAAPAFAWASWSNAWYGASWVALAELACRKGDWADALESLERVLSANALQTRALNLSAAVLRRAGHLDAAERMAARSAAVDPLDLWAANELALVKARRGSADADRAAADLKARLRGEVESYLELGCDYAAAGLWDEAIDVLGRIAPADEKGTVDPVVFYHLGYYWKRKGEPDKAARCWRLAARMPVDYCFPFRLETVDALRAALDHDARDPVARYALGNALFDGQPEPAVREWTKAMDLLQAAEAGRAASRRLHALVARNLGWAAVHRGKAPEGKAEPPERYAVACYRYALDADPDDPQVLMEWDQACEMAGVPLDERLKTFDARRATALKKNSTLARLVRLYTLFGRHDEAIDLLTKHHFRLWEGESGGGYRLYVDAQVARGRARRAAGQAAEAVKDFEAAIEVPPNIDVWAEFTTYHSRIRYELGLAYKALGDAAKAAACFEEASAARDGANGYFGALALAELGKREESAKVLDALVQAGRKKAAEAAAREDDGNYQKRFWRLRGMAEQHYVAGLGLLGLGRAEEATAEFRKAVHCNGSHTGAWTELMNK